MDQRVTHSRLSAKNTRSSNFGILLKDFRAKIPKKLKASASYTILAKVSNKAHKNKKKYQHSYNQDGKEQKSYKRTILATKVNALESGYKKKKKKKKTKQNISQVTYYKCDKKEHYSSTCSYLTKN